MTDIRCPHCERTFPLPEGEPAPRRARPSTAPTMTCPKCGTTQPEAPACRSCGLLTDRMAEFSATQDRDTAPEVLAAWQVLEGRWDDPDAHVHFLELAATAGAFPWAARAYRQALRARPDDPRATEQLARLARMAEATLRASATPPVVKSSPPYRNVLLVVGVLILLAALGVVYTMMVPHHEPSSTTPSRPAKPHPPVHPK